MVRKTAYYGLFLALALVLSYVEAMIPFSFGIPGVKLGLANSMTLFILYMGTPLAALGILVLRIVLSGFMFGNLFGILYGMAGGLFSFLMMLLAKKSKKLSVYGVSMTGGVCHNIAQVAVAALIVQNATWLRYMPVVLVSGILTGLLIGIISAEILRRIPKNWKL